MLPSMNLPHNSAIHSSFIDYVWGINTTIIHKNIARLKKQAFSQFAPFNPSTSINFCHWNHRFAGAIWESWIYCLNHSILIQFKGNIFNPKEACNIQRQKACYNETEMQSWCCFQIVLKPCNQFLCTVATLIILWEMPWPWNMLRTTTKKPTWLPYIGALLVIMEKPLINSNSKPIISRGLWQTRHSNMHETIFNEGLLAPLG